jgi:hypothetical protein
MPFEVNIYNKGEEKKEENVRQREMSVSGEKIRGLSTKTVITVYHQRFVFLSYRSNPFTIKETLLIICINAQGS